MEKYRKGYNYINDEKKRVRNIAIVSLSRGTIGEKFVAHEIKIGLERLKEYGINVKFMPNALKGIEKGADCFTAPFSILEPAPPFLTLYTDISVQNT